MWSHIYPLTPGVNHEKKQEKTSQLTTYFK